MDTPSEDTAPPPAYDGHMRLTILHSGDRYVAFRDDMPGEHAALMAAIAACVEKRKIFDVQPFAITVEELWSFIMEKDRYAEIFYQLLTTDDATLTVGVPLDLGTGEMEYPSPAPADVPNERGPDPSDTAGD